MASGPVFWIVGVTGSSEQVTQLGVTLLWLLLAIPALAFLVGTFNAYRPGSSELYEPVEYAFSEEGIDLAHPGRRAHAEWSEFRSWRMSAGCYLLDLSKTRFLIVPVSAVPGEARGGLESLLESNLGPRRR